jgi:hypothetical protein
VTSGTETAEPAVAEQDGPALAASVGRGGLAIHVIATETGSTRPGTRFTYAYRVCAVDDRGRELRSFGDWPTPRKAGEVYDALAGG